MRAYRRKACSLQTKRPKPLLASFACLFYVCKILGLNSQDWNEFRQHKHLKKSETGEYLAVIVIIISCINFNLMVLVFQSKTYAALKNPLALGIGFLLTYYILALLVNDRITALLKQQSFLNIFQELQEVDEDLYDLNIILNNNYIKYCLVVAIFLTTVVETLSFAISFTLYVGKIKWTSWLWVFYFTPSFFNTLDKLWYAGILIAIRTRFQVINNAFDNEALRMEQELFKPAREKQEKNIKKPNFQNQIRPVCATVDSRLVKYCQLHDTLCNVANQLNEVYGFSHLMLMGYGVFVNTAQLYFFYCVHTNQMIPSMFRSAQCWSITLLYIVYISSKCISILYGNWLTTLASKKSGTCMHRCAMAADKSESYELINHLSLKLLHHRLNFNACGYFALNMATLFSFCGGITTYLIIFIQFNLEEHKVTFKSENGESMTLMRSITHDSFIVENVVNATRNENITLLLDAFYQMWNKNFKNV